MKGLLNPSWSLPVPSSFLIVHLWNDLSGHFHMSDEAISDIGTGACIQSIASFIKLIIDDSVINEINLSLK